MPSAPLVTPYGVHGLALAGAATAATVDKARRVAINVFMEQLVVSVVEKVLFSASVRFYELNMYSSVSFYKSRCVTSP